MARSTLRRYSTPRELIEKYQRAFALCAHEHTDLAAARDLLLECVLADPENQIFTESFLHVLGRCSPPPGRWRGFWTRLAFEQARRAQHWPRLVQTGLRLLTIRPRDGLILCGLGTALEHLRNPTVAQLYWQAAQAAETHNVLVQRHCAQAFTRLGLFDDARGCWQRVQHLAPRDPDAAAQLAQLRSPPQDPPQLPATAPGKHPGADTGELCGDDWQQLAQQAARLALAGDLQAARQCLAQAARLRPAELAIIQQQEELALAFARRQLELARQQGTGETLVAQFQNHLARQELEVFTARSLRHPTEQIWKLKLAQSLVKVGSFHQACQILAEMEPDATSDVERHLTWGESLQHQRLWQPALDHYRQAAAAADPTRGEPDRLACYRHGTLALQLHRPREAAESLLRLAHASPGYKDTQQHLDKIDSIRHKDGFL